MGFGAAPDGRTTGHEPISPNLSLPPFRKCYPREEERHRDGRDSKPGAGRGKSSAETQEGAENLRYFGIGRKPQKCDASPPLPPGLRCPSPNLMQYYSSIIVKYSFWRAKKTERRERSNEINDDACVVRYKRAWSVQVFFMQVTFFFLSYRPLRASTTRNALFRVFPSASTAALCTL